MQVTGSLENLLQGVSQQPQRDRLPGQCSAQDNAVADVVNGWRRRPPSDHAATLFTGTAGESAYWTFYDTGTERYLVCFLNGQVRVFDMVGGEKTVNNAGVHSYLASSNPFEDFSAVTIGDYTIVANRQVIPAMSSTVRDWLHGAVVVCRGGENGKFMHILSDGATVASYGIPQYGGEGAGTDRHFTSTENIINELNLSLAPNPFLNGYQFANCLYITHDSGTGLMNLSTMDGHGGEDLYLVQRECKEVAKLPKFAPPNMVVRIIGEDNEDDDLYMRFDAAAWGTEGVWRETAQPGVQEQFNYSTMPHALVRLPNGTFYFGPLDGSTQSGYVVEKWLRRDAGDTESNPLPEFIGHGIEGLGVYQNRMYILASETVSFSRTNSYFGFWRETASVLLDTDPISIASTYGLYTPLRAGVQHNRSLVLLSDRVQFIIKNNNGITPRNATIEVSTTFESDLLAQPVVAGENIFFGINYGTHAGVRELYTQSEVDSNTSRPITAHVEKFIPGRARCFASSSNLDTLLVSSLPLSNVLYVYEYTWDGPKRLQSAWGRWVFPSGTKILYHFFIEAVAYVVYQNAVGTYLSKIDLTDQPYTNMDFNIYLDRRVKVTPVAGVFIMPYAPSGVAPVVVEGPDGPYPGRLIAASVSGSTVTLTGWVSGSVVYGYPYTTMYSPTMPFIKDDNGIVVGNTRLTLGEFIVTYEEAGTFKTKLVVPHYPDITMQCSTRVLGGLSALVGAVGIGSGQFSIPVRAVVEEGVVVEIYTDSHLPLQILDIEWAGQYTRKGWRL